MTDRDVVAMADEAIMAAWRHLAGRYARPWRSPAAAGDMAAAALLAVWGAAAVRYRADVDALARDDPDTITDADDALYAGSTRRGAAVSALLIAASGVRVLCGRADVAGVAPDDLAACGPLGDDADRPVPRPYRRGELYPA